MATFKKFEDILAWQKARKVTKAIYEAIAQSRFSRDFGLRDQAQRAVVHLRVYIQRLVQAVRRNLTNDSDAGKASTWFTTEVVCLLSSTRDSRL